MKMKTIDLNNIDYGPAPESDKLAIEWLANHKHSFGHFINGKFTNKSIKQFATINPANGKKLASISLGTAKEINQAINAANIAQKKWINLGGFNRAKILYKLARLVQRNARLFAVLETLDNGKPIRETRDIDIPLVARHFYHHAGWAQLQDTEFNDYEPVGVVGQIVPWNFPLLMLAWKVAPALALGNAVILKPAEQTPLSALLFANLASRAGLPAGILNIITGDGSTGKALVEAKGINKIAFTGSTEVGRLIRKITAGSEKSLTLELGGKSPFIVFNDADLDAAVEGIVDGVWFNQGQVCCAGSRLLVQEDVAKKFEEKLVRRLNTMRVGNPLDKNTDVGAIISPMQLQRIKRLVKVGVKDGAKLFQGKNNPNIKQGNYYPPTLLSNIPNSSLAVVEEIFGPVLVSMTFRTSEEAINLANNTRYGLAASVYSETIGLALEIAPRIAAGVVWINSTNLFDAAVGFGGYRESGFGREGGIEGVYEYLKPKNIFTKKLAKEIKVQTKANNKITISDEIDRTAKLFIAGKQQRADGGYSYPIYSAKNKFIAEAARGNRKDIRDAVLAARKGCAWTNASTHTRAQVLYYLAENLAVREKEIIARLRLLTNANQVVAKKEFDLSIQRLFYYAAWCDKHEGVVHQPPIHGLALAINEALGVVAVICPEENPLLSMISLVAPLLATGNRVVVVPASNQALIATDFYQVIETSDLPAGSINIVTGYKSELLPTLAGHLDVDAIWTFSDQADSKLTEELSTANLKRTLVNNGYRVDWFSDQAQGRTWLKKAIQVKNIWIPYGD